MHRVHDQSPRFNRRPQPPLVINRLYRDQAHGEHELGAHQFPVIRLGLSGPRQKRGNVLRHLRLRRGCAVVVLHAPVHEHLGHGDGAAWEVRVVMKALPNVDPGGGFPVPQQQRKHVVLSVVPCFGDQGQVGRVRAVVRVTRAFFVRVGRGELIRKLARPVEHLAGVVGAVHDLDLFRHQLDLVLGVRHPHQVSVRHQVQAVARGAHLLVHLVPASD
mmetsp:Transcript_3413/g.12626  ORF Transcript_3413/g.12626 Transcript_3413/m.12626 type:complete len:217 (-) Transcript_3413:283-933(-)